MIKAVMWDFGGVLTSSPFEAFARYEVEHGLPTDFIRQTNATNPDHNAWARFERSEISADLFDVEFAGETRARGHEVRGRDVLELLAGDLRPTMVEALRTVSRQYKTACLTNNVKSGEGPAMQPTTDRAARMAEVMSIFDVVIESSVIGLRKPDPRFYLKACEELQISPEEAVFLDDLGINLKPARELGMATIKVVDPDHALADLSDILGIDLPGTP